MQTEAQLIRVVLVSQDAVFCRELRRLWASAEGLRLVAQAPDMARAQQLARELNPDILLLDLTSFTCTETAGLSGAGASAAPARIVAILDRVDREAVIDALRLGAHGIARRQLPGHVLPECVRRVAAGQPAFDGEALAILVSVLRDLLPRSKRPIAPGDYKLTPREVDIIANIARGRSNREVGETFSISERTVKHYLTGIFDKVGVSNRVELALFAVHHETGWLHAAAVREPARMAASSTR